MCGICGIYNFAGVSPIDQAIVRRMMERLEHRGPDGDGAWAGSQAVLGHRRLAIIDLAGGHQPLFNETGEVGVILNGEIYNYRELSQELKAAGHRFSTASDTEVIVHGYEEWGDDFVTRLRGMFAFALWDEPRRRFLLGRDRFGVKPLYYAETKDRLLFASEIKALFADEEVPRRLNAARLAEYLAFRSVAGEETLFEGVREVAPGTVQIYEDGRHTERRYWSPEVPLASNGHAGELLERGRGLLSDAVRARLVSDVPLGTITSGGLDSSLVSAIAAEHADGPIDTFCVGFGDAAYDERPFARVVADQIKSRHHTIEVSPADIERELDRLTWAHDEPLTHPNSIPMHLIFRDAKERVGVTVLLSGEGADEVFGGYEWYAVAQRRDALRRVPALSLLASASPAFGKLATLKKVMRRDYLVAANAVSGHATVSSLVSGGHDYLRRRSELWPAGVESADGMFVYDQRTYLAPLLQRQDRMSMAAGLEAREPFLDHKMAEWANALRADVKLQGGTRKALLKQLAARWLPAEIIHRRKVGFEMPLGQWLRRGGPLAYRVQALRDRGSLAGEFVERAEVERLIAEHDRGDANHADILWSLVALDSWGSIFLGAHVQSQRLPGAATGRAMLA
ncbi:MAG: asparagine synthase (glutamine-hydrolyzing) [Pyrinomonadaceae bacterium]